LHCCRTVTNTIILEADETAHDVGLQENVELVFENDGLQISYPEEEDKDQSEEPEQPNGDSVPQQPKKRRAITKLSGESILKVFKRNSEERSKLMSNLINQQKEQPKEQHPIDVFFQSMAMTVKKFSPANQIRVRMEICQTVSQVELEEVNTAYDASSSALQSPSISDNCDDDDPNNNLLTFKSGMTFK
jgi:hypothetical protein